MVGSSDCELLWSQVSCFSGFSYGVSKLSGLHSPSSFFLARIPQVSLIFVCRFLCLFPSLTRQRLLDDNWHSHQYECNKILLIIITLTDFFFSDSSWFYLQSLGNLAFRTWHSRNSVWGSLTLVACASDWTCQWLATPSTSALPLPQHIPEAGQTTNQWLCGWFATPTPQEMDISRYIPNNS